MRALLLAVLLLGCASPAPGPTTVEAFTPLLGCWRGTFDNAPNVYDERCFEQLGENVVDIHHVRPTDYSGETTFHDDGAGGIIFAYAASDGGRSNGAVRMEEGRFIIAPHTHVGGSGTEFHLRSSWTLEGPDRLIMQTEREENGVWSAYMRISYARAERTAE